MIAKKTEKWFKVVYGFNALNRISIQRDELQKALYAQKFGEVVQIKDRQINGKYIIDISPDWNKYTGWYETYEAKDGDDMAQIERDCPKDLNDIIREEREKVDWLVSHNQKHLIGKNIDIPELVKENIGKIQSPEIKKISEDLSEKFKIK